MTEYVILRKDDDQWTQGATVTATVTASGAEAAIRAIENLSSGLYVAVPLRSWKPTPVRVEQTTKVKIG